MGSPSNKYETRWHVLSIGTTWSSAQRGSWILLWSKAKQMLTSPGTSAASCVQVALAVELKLPLFLHCRDAAEDFTRILRSVLLHAHTAKCAHTIQ